MARRLGIFLLFFAATLLAVTAYWLLFTVFMAYDDEGYVLVSLRNYSAYGGLYSQVYSQYGPFFYFLHDLGHRLLGYEFTNTTGRFFTLLCWLVAAGASAHLVWRRTRTITLTGFTLGLTFFHLWLMVSEPIHPGGLIAALVATGAWLGVIQIERGAMRSLAVTSGLLGAALLLGKINVGIFFLAAAGAWFVVQLGNPGQARAATLIVAPLLAVLPFALMHTQLAHDWSRLFAALSAVASLTMLSVAWSERRPLTAWSQAGLGGGALLALGVAVMVTVCLRGTTVPELLNGVLLDPLRHPGVYHFPPAWKPGTGLAGGTSLLLAILVWNVQAGRLSWLFVGLRLLIAGGFGLACLEWLPFTSHSFTMSYVVPFAWVFALRLDPDKADTHPSATTWVGLLLVLQYLHAFPVAGSQVAWGTFLAVPLMALGLHDARRFVALRGLKTFPAVIGFTCLSLAVGATSRLGVLGWKRYSESRPLLLPGADNVRLPEAFASALRLLVLNATVHGDLLFTLPGLFSLNEWTRLPTPTLTNTTHWFSLLNRRQQEEIAQALDRSKRPVFIVQRDVMDFLAENKFSAASPLNEYLNQNFERVFSLEHYEFWVRRGRTILPLGSAEFLQLKALQPGLPPAKLELAVAIPTGSKIACIELTTLEGRPQVLARWDRDSGPLLHVEVNLEGAVMKSGGGSVWNFPLPPVMRLTLPLEKLPAVDRHKVVIYLRDANNALLAEARFMD